MLWTDGSVRFLFGKGGSGLLANCSLCGTEATLSFLAGPVFSSFSAEACAILQVLAGLGSTNKPATSLLSSFYLTLALSSPSFLLPQFLRQIWQELSSLSSYSIKLQWVPGHSFLSGNDAVDDLARRECYLCSLQSLVVSLLLSLVSTHLFSRTGGVLFYRNSSTHKFPRFPPRNLCSLITLTVFSIVYDETDTAFS